MATVKSYSGVLPRKREILRYAGVLGEVGELDAVIDSCMSELSSGLRYLVCYEECDIRTIEGGVCIGNMTVRSESFRKYIGGCECAVVFCATVGLYPDRLIKRYGRVSPSRALMVDAIGSELVEALCDLFCKELKEGGADCLPRFSPGYGDLPLELQRDIFSMLDCERKIGVTLGESLLMTPTKSVTAIVGIK